MLGSVFGVVIDDGGACGDFAVIFANGIPLFGGASVIDGGELVTAGERVHIDMGDFCRNGNAFQVFAMIERVAVDGDDTGGKRKGNQRSTAGEGTASND